MRSVVKEDETVGLLLFDEPSASLDPAAEHGKRLSTLLCMVRGGKTNADAGAGQTCLIA